MEWEKLTVEIKMEEQEIARLTIGLFTFRLLKRPDGTYKSEPSPEPHGLFSPSSSASSVLLRTFLSQSNPSISHSIFQLSSGRLYCTCTGFSVHGKCWHMDTITTKNKEDN